MVGVPGRSAGCRTCRKRKKKCDLQRPLCGNCTRGNFVCGGYGRDMIMIQVDKHGKGTYQVQQPQKTKSQSIKQVAVIPSFADVRCKDLNRTTFELECLAGFRQGFTPELISDTWNSSKNTRPPFMDAFWGHILLRPQHTELMRTSLLAMGAFYVGSIRGDLNLRMKGLELYGNMLGMLRKGLTTYQPAKKSLTNLDEDVAGYTILIFEYLREEFAELPRSDSGTERFRAYYMSDEKRYNSTRTRAKLTGILDLMSKQDPIVFAEPIRHHVFVQLRAVHITVCFDRRKRTFLADDEWLTKPWIGHSKTYHDTIFDAMMAIPGLLEDLDSLRARPKDEDTTSEAALVRVQSCLIHARLQRWHDHLSTACKSIHETQRRILRHSIETLNPTDLSPILCQQDKWYLFAWTMYWLTCIIFYGTVPIVYIKFPPTANEPLVISPHTIGTYCLAIAKSLKFFVHRDRTSILGEALIRMPVGVVHVALRNPYLRASGDPQLKQAEDILRSFGSEGPQFFHPHGSQP